MGRVLLQTNREAQAIEEFKRTLALNQNLAAAHSLIGLAKLVDGHPEETESYELEALHASPRDTDANVWVAYMALAKLHLGLYEDALDLYHRSIELNRNYATGRFYFAATLVELRRLDEAKTEVKAALALNPKFNLRRYRDGGKATIQSSLVSGPKVVESRESVVIQGRRTESGGRRCGRTRTERNTNGINCDTRVT